MFASNICLEASRAKHTHTRLPWLPNTTQAYISIIASIITPKPKCQELISIRKWGHGLHGDTRFFLIQQLWAHFRNMQLTSYLCDKRCEISSPGRCTKHIDNVNVCVWVTLWYVEDEETGEGNWEEFHTVKQWDKIIIHFKYSIAF